MDKFKDFHLRKNIYLKLNSGAKKHSVLVKYVKYF